MLTNEDIQTINENLQEETTKRKSMSEQKNFDIGYVRGEPYFNIHADTAVEMEELIKEGMPVFKRFREAVEKGKQAQLPLKTNTSYSNGSKPKSDRMALSEAIDKGLVDANYQDYVCPTCGDQVNYVTGFGKKGKWEALMCPNGNKEDPHQVTWL